MRTDKYKLGTIGFCTGGSVKPNGSPSGLTLTAITDTTALGAFTSTSTDQDGYKLFKSTDGINYAEHSTVTFNTLSFTATGLTAGTKYWLYVCAYKGSGLSQASNVVIIEAETTTYYARVIADGGVVIDATKVNADITLLKSVDEMSNLKMAMSGYGGMKIENNNGERGISKLYDYFNATYDAVQNTSTLRPINALLSNAINHFYFGSDSPERKLTHTSLSLTNFTAFYICQKNVAASLAEYLHGGNGEGFYNNSVYFVTGPGEYKSTAHRASDSYTDQLCHLITFQPSHIYLDGTEVTYKSGMTSDVTPLALTTIGGRSDVTFLGHEGEMGFICIYDSIISDAKRLTLESYFKINYVDKEYLPSYTQLTYKIWYQKDNVIFAAHLTEGKLLYSTNNGVIFKEYSFANSAKLQMGYIFSNGNIFFCTDTKAYKSTDNLDSIVEITIKDLLGNTHIPTANDENFLASNKIYSQSLPSGSEMIVFGNYTIQSTSPVCVWYSIDGNNLKMAYRFGTSYDYDARHIHNCIYSSTIDKWYVTTGDSSTQVHWVSGRYVESTDTWAWSLVVSGSDTNQYKAESLQIEGSNFYWGGDSTTNNLTNGIWHCPIGQEATIGNHIRDFFHVEETASMLVESNRIIFTTWNATTRGWDIFIYDRNKYICKQYFLNFSITRPIPSAYTYWMWHIENVKDGEYILQPYKYGSSEVFNTIKFYI